MAVPAVFARGSVKGGFGGVVQRCIVAGGAVRDVQYRCQCAADIDIVIQRIGGHIVPVGVSKRLGLV